MKAAYASFILGLLFLIPAFLLRDEAMDITYDDGTVLVIGHWIIFGVLSLLLFLTSFLLFRKHKSAKINRTK